MWQDNRPVALLSTAHNPNKVVAVPRKEKDGSRTIIPWPKVIQDHTNYIRDVDRFDQTKEIYSVSRRSCKYWFILFYLLLDSALVNAYFLLSVSNASRNPAMKHLDFNKHASLHLIGTFSSRKKKDSFLANYLNKNLKLMAKQLESLLKCVLQMLAATF